MAKKEEQNLTTDKRPQGRPSTPPKFKSTRSKSSRELFYLVTALASFIRIVMQFVHR